MLNYKFRDATQDFDVILKTVTGVNDVIARFADKYGLPGDWMNTDFMKTVSYSDVLAEVSKHYYTLNNGSLEIRTVAGVYLIAMKIRAHRDFRNDISDAIGIMIEETENGNAISFEDIKCAYKKLYNEEVPDDLMERIQGIFTLNLDEIKEYYAKQKASEGEIGGRIVTYINDGADINTRNVDDVIARMKEKIKEKNE